MAAGLSVFGFPGTALAGPQAEDSCSSHLPAAESRYGIPRGLLSAIALTESGNEGEPYPWAFNLGGQPRFAEDYAAAVRLLRDRGGAPRRDMAVGCMQIHMRYHLASVGSPEWILQPRNNVLYAAAFLRRLFDQYGDWRLAVGHYNASDPAAQHLYQCQVGRSLARIAPATAAALALPGDCSAAYRVVPSGGVMRFGPQILYGIGYGVGAVPAASFAPAVRRSVAVGKGRHHAVTIIHGRSSDQEAAAIKGITIPPRSSPAQIRLIKIDRVKN